MIFGTINNMLKSMTLKSKWEIKKNDEGKLTAKEKKEEREKYLNLSEDERTIYNFKEQMANDKKAEKLTGISYKIMLGKKLTNEEIEYLKVHNPEALRDYEQNVREKRAFEEKLKHCKTKEDVERVKMNELSGHFTQVKSIISNPHIGKAKKAVLLQKILGKVNNESDVYFKFIESGEYASLKTDQEVLDEAKENKEEITETSEELAEDIKEDIEANEEMIEDTLDELDDANEELETEDELTNDIKEKADVVIKDIKNNKKTDVHKYNKLEKKKITKIETDVDIHELDFEMVRVEINKALGDFNNKTNID